MDAVNAVSLTLLHDQLRSVLATLPERESRILQLRFGLTDGHPPTLDQISRPYGGTRERVRQIEVQMIDKLRHTFRSEMLRDYLT